MYSNVKIITYAIGGETLVYRRLHMDTLSNYDFNLKNIFGAPNLLVQLG